MKMLLAFVTLALLVVGCSHSNAVHVVGPDGSSNWVAIHCRGQQACWELAGEECPGGYDVMDRQGGTAVVGYGSATRYGAFATTRSFFEGDMLVKCHGAPAEHVSCNSSAQCRSEQWCSAYGECTASR